MSDVPFTKQKLTQLDIAVAKAQKWSWLLALATAAVVLIVRCIGGR